jgi:hypothetical protein
MTDIFLSASVPLPSRDRRFFDTADVLSIREAIKALVEVVLPRNRLTCGGHPAITPLLALFAREAGLESHGITIFQSELYEDMMPREIAHFVDVRIVRAIDHDKAASLTLMREEMIRSRQFAAAVIIGGMDGVFEELDMFVKYHPGAVVLPIATTGAAAAMIYRNGRYDEELSRDLTFPSLFRRRLPLDPSDGPARRA